MAATINPIDINMSQGHFLQCFLSAYKICDSRHFNGKRTLLITFTKRADIRTRLVMPILSKMNLNY